LEVGSWEFERSEMTRRELLRTAAFSLGGVAVPIPWAAACPDCRPRLVIVRLHGGADGLSLVVPWRDPAYRRARPTIAVPPPGQGAHAALDLDGTFGLHPRLAPLLPLFRHRTLDIMPACGLATATRAHLVAIERLDATIERIARARGGLETTGRSLPLARALEDTAVRIRAGAAAAVVVVHATGWDHHAGQRDAAGPFAAVADDLAHGLAGFARSLGPDLAGTTVVTVSEFGRAVRENACGGSEHGHATAAFVLGGGVRRGRIVGGWPGLSGDVVPPTVQVTDALTRLV
jgi:uncharacterized protein (DUF1501 family)